MYPEYNTGLNGGLNSWFSRHYHAIALAVTAVCPLLGAAIEAAGDAGWFDGNNGNKSAVLEPTPKEQIIINAWVNDKYTPFIKEIAGVVQNLFNEPDFTIQIQTINHIKWKVCAVKQYFLNNETNGLSQNAIDYRLNLIEKTLLTVENLINDALYGHDELDLVQFNDTTPSVNMFFPLFIQNYNYSCEKYVIRTTEVVMPNGTTVTVPVGTTVTATGTIVLPPATTVSGVTNIVPTEVTVSTPLNTGVVNPSNTGVVTPKPKTNMVVGLIAGIGILYVLFSGKKSKK